TPESGRALLVPPMHAVLAHQLSTMRVQNENGISKVAKPLPQYQHQGTQGEDRRSRRTSVTSYLQATSPKGPTRVRRTGQVLPEEKPWERWMSSRVSRGPRGDALLGLLERWGRRGGIDGRAR